MKPRGAFIFLLLVAAHASALDLDSIKAEVDSLKVKIVNRTGSRSSTRWIGQLLQANFDINAPGIDYPRFPATVVKAYNIFDRVFNSYDSLYVVNASGSWKATLVSQNHVTASTFLFPHSDYKISLNSIPYSDISASISFKSLSLGTSINLNKLFGRPLTRHSFTAEFTTSRVSGNFTYSSSAGGMHINQLGETRFPISHRIPFDDVTIRSLSCEVFYIFNHMRYSRAAAYGYSKMQLRSAGSWVAGLLFARQSIRMDFSTLPDDYLENLPDGRTIYNLDYNDYTLLGGYSYNLVIRPNKWMCNFGARLATGYRHANDHNIGRNHTMMANDITARSALLYYHGRFFAAASVYFTGYLYFTSRFSNFTSFINVAATAGIRF